MGKSYFSYCPLVWMFYSNKPNNKINLIHHARLTLKDKTRDVSELLVKNKDISFHKKLLQNLIIEIYKMMNHFIPAALNSLFDFCKNAYVTRNFKKFQTHERHTV